MIDLWNPHTIMIESIITRLNQQPTCVRLNHDNPTAWPVHQNSLEDRLQVPSHLVVGSPFAEAERSRESRCSVKSDSVQTATRCGWNFLGKKEWIYVYTFRERERDLFIYCHLTKIYEMNTFYQPILVIFSQISRFEKTCYQNSSKKQVSCHLFPLEKRLIVHPQISRGFTARACGKRRCSSACASSSSGKRSSAPEVVGPWTSQKITCPESCSILNF